MRYHVRNGRGEELVVPSLADLHGLYAQGFIEEDDLVRAERSEQWVKASQMPALAGVRTVRREPGKLRMLIVAAIAFVAISVGAVRHLNPLGLIFAAIVFAAGVAALRPGR
jgi:hypothetical protein